MKFSKKYSIYLIILLSLGIITPVLIALYYPDKPIEIDSDEDFENYNFSGTGTEEDPFLIENLKITRRNNDDYETAIKITSTTKHFIIRNCKIKNYHSAIYLYYTGIRTVQITNNHIEDCHGTAIYSNSGHNIVISGNTVINCNYGITINTCYNSTIENNLLYHNYLGLKVVNSPYSIIAGNNASNNNFWGGTISESSHSQIYDNVFNNHPRGYEGDSSSGVGLSISRSSFIDFRNNTCIENGNTGIEVSIVSFSNFSFNNFSLSTNGNGMTFEDSENNLIWMNVIQENNHWGISFKLSSYNIIYQNAFIRNGNSVESNAFEELCFNNVWYNLDLLKGNYWYGWNISVPYEISGQGSIDPYPLENNPVN